MLYVGLPLCAEILLHKPIVIGATVAVAGSLVTPVWFVLSDIITEIYGFKTSKIMFFCMFIVCFIVSLLITALIHLPSPVSWNGASAYELVVGHLIRQFSAGLLGLIVGGYLNIVLISKWGVLLNGGYFWFRSIAASALGEIVFTSIAFFISLYGTDYSDDLPSLIFWGIVLKLIGNIILAFPANMLVIFIKRNDYAFMDSPVLVNPFVKK